MLGEFVGFQWCRQCRSMLPDRPLTLSMSELFQAQFWQSQLQQWRDDLAGYTPAARNLEELNRPMSACSACWEEHRQRSASLECCRAGDADILIASGSEYSGVIKHLIYRLKYDRDDIVMHEMLFLALRAWRRLAACLDEDELATVVFVPIPLHWTKYLKRGFNQADWIAQELGRHARFPCDAALLQRRSATRAQHGLTRAQRYANISGAFAVSRRNRTLADAQLTVVLVDDLYTSGATLIAAATALLSSGAVRRVCAVAVAMATIASHR